jgi:hypothetical protein
MKQIVTLALAGYVSVGVAVGVGVGVSGKPFIIEIHNDWIGSLVFRGNMLQNQLSPPSNQRHG